MWISGWRRTEGIPNHTRSPPSTSWAAWSAWEQQLAFLCCWASLSRWTSKVGKRQDEPGILWKTSNGCQPSPGTAVRTNTGTVSEMWVQLFLLFFYSYPVEKTAVFAQVFIQDMFSSNEFHYSVNLLTYKTTLFCSCNLLELLKKIDKGHIENTWRPPFGT